MEAAWHACLCVEGLRTTDHRALAPGSLTWRTLPWPIFAQTKNAGHQDAPIVGNVENVFRDPADDNRILAEGTFDLASAEGQEAARMCADQTLRFGSIDLEILSSAIREIGGGGDPLDILFGDDSGEADWYEEVTEGRICGYTMVPIPAFPQAVIAPASMPLPDAPPMGVIDMITPGLLAAAAGGPDVPPGDWFDDPGELLDNVIPIGSTSMFHLADEGRIMGYVACWNSRHISMPGQIKPPRNGSGYAYFLTGETKTLGADGEVVKIRTGVLTAGGGHADEKLTYRPAADHYDNVATAVADVTCGENARGIWFAGSLRPDVAPEMIRALSKRTVSGDWRVIGGQYEMIAALAVNVPGFPMPRSLAASGHELLDEFGFAYDEGIVRTGWKNGEQISLVAAGTVHDDPRMAALRKMAARIVEQDQKIEAHGRMLDALRPQIAEALTARIGATF